MSTARFSARVAWDGFTIDPADAPDFGRDEIPFRMRARAHVVIKRLCVDNEHMSAATDPMKESPRGTGGPVSTG